MKCPHCKTSIHAGYQTTELGYIGKHKDQSTYWQVLTMECPECHEAIIHVVRRHPSASGRITGGFSAYPNRIPPREAPEGVPDHIKEDFDEAAIVLQDSAKASSALSRRCLHQLLIDNGVSKNDQNLAAAIDDAMKFGFPSHISENLDHVREAGNFAVHTRKSLHSGEIQSVEPGEAEWNLDVLEMLFDYFYIAPAKAQAKRDAMNAKLKEAGKKELKQPKEKDD
jgi:Domain of unknown function (DUF4145)